MEISRSLTAVLFLSLASVFGQIRINEIDSDTVGVDSVEFVELFSPPGPMAESLNGVAMVFFEGSDPSDSVYLAIDLSGNAFGPSGLFVVGDSGVSNADLSLGPDVEQIRNGVNAIAIYSGTTAADYLSGALTVPTTGPELIDFVIHKTGDFPDDESLPNIFGPSEQPSESTGGSATTQSIQRNPDGASNFATDTPTPGNSNVQLPSVFASASPVQFLESTGAGASTITLTREGDPAESLTLRLSQQLRNPRIDIPGVVTFPPGESSITFELDSNSSSFNNGDSIVQIIYEDLAQPPVFQDGSVTLLLEDDDLPFPSLVINEILRSGDGPRSAEYVEIYNGSSNSVDLTGFRVLFYGNAVSEFGALQETVLLDSLQVGSGDFLLIGNELVASRYGVTPDILIDGLDLPDDEVTVILLDPSNRPVFSASLQSNSTSALSNLAGAPLVMETRIETEDTIPAVGYFLQDDGVNEPRALERVDPGASAPSATPGRTNLPVPSLSLARDRFLAEENDSEGVTFVISRIPADTSADIEVSLLSSSASSLQVPSSVTIPAGSTSASFIGMLPADSVLDGIRTVTVSATADGLADTSVDITILDSDVPDLSPGDIFFVAALSDDPQSFAFVTLVDLPESTRIDFTDNGWRADGGFREGEGFLTWLATESYPAGTVVSFSRNRPELGAAFGQGLSLSPAGDQILAFQEEVDAPRLIAGIQMQGPWDGDAIDEATSALPDALSESGAVELPTGDSNVAYQGSLSGTLAELQAALSNASNFVASGPEGGVNFSSVPTAFTIEVGGALFTVSNPEIFVSQAGVRLVFTASGPSDIYVTTDLISYELVDGGGAVPSGEFLDVAPPSGRGFYLIQEAGAPAP